jgi:hypothetical protein
MYFGTLVGEYYFRRIIIIPVSAGYAVTKIIFHSGMSEFGDANVNEFWL